MLHSLWNLLTFLLSESITSSIRRSIHFLVNCYFIYKYHYIPLPGRWAKESIKKWSWRLESWALGKSEKNPRHSVKSSQRKKNKRLTRLEKKTERKMPLVQKHGLHNLRVRSNSCVTLAKVAISPNPRLPGDFLLRHLDLLTHTRTDRKNSDRLLSLSLLPTKKWESGRSWVVQTKNRLGTMKQNRF